MSKRGKLPPGKKPLPMTVGGKAPRCQAIKVAKEGKKYGEQCKNPAIHGRPFCKFHGGRAGRPIIHGGRSKYQPVPRGLAARFETARVDPNLLNLSDNIALLDAYIYQICEEAERQTSFNPTQTKKLLALMREKRNLTQSEIERRIAIGSLMPIEDVLQLIQYVYSVVNKHVPDNLIKQKIGAELRDIIRPAAVAAEAKKQAVVPVRA